MQLDHIVRQKRGSIVDWMKGKEEYKDINAKIKVIWRVRVILTIVALSSILCMMYSISLLVSGASMAGWVVTLALSWFGVPLVLGAWLVREDTRLLVEVFPAFLSEAPNEFKEKEVGRLMEAMNSKDQKIFSKKYYSIATFKSCTILSILLYLPLTLGNLIVYAIKLWIHIGVLIVLASFAFIIVINYLFYFANYERFSCFDLISSFALAMFLGVGIMRIQYINIEAFSIGPVLAYSFVFYEVRSWARKKAEKEIIPRLIDDLTHYFEGEDELELRYWTWAFGNIELVKKAIAQGHLDYLEMSATEIVKKAAKK